MVPTYHCHIELVFIPSEIAQYTHNDLSRHTNVVGSYRHKELITVLLIILFGDRRKENNVSVIWTFLGVKCGQTQNKHGFKHKLLMTSWDPSFFPSGSAMKPGTINMKLLCTKKVMQHSTGYYY